jgi:hypothetical protein
MKPSARANALAPRCRAWAYVDDQKLTQFVAKQYSLPSINLGEIEIDAAVLKLVPKRDLREAPGHPGQPQRPDAGRRDGRPVEHLRDRRAQVPHPVQHRARGRERGRARRPRSRSYYDKGPDLDQMMGELDDIENVDFAAGDDASTSSISRTRPARRRSSSCATRSCSPRSRRRRPTSTSSPTRRASACATASTASSTRRCGRRSSCERDHLAHQDHGVARHRRAPAPAGRSHQAQDRHQQGDGLPRLGLPTLFGEKIVMRLLDKSNLQLDMTKLGFEAGAARRLQDLDQEALRHGAGHRPHRLGQDHHALLGAAELNTETSTSAPPRIRSSSTSRHQPGADARGHRPQLRRRAALVPPPGPEHHHGRRDPRLRDRRDRGQGRAHRPPGALDAAHQRRAVDRQRACSTWASSRSW